MQQDDSNREAPDGGRASHGPASEVTWDEGKGRQPYANQEQEAGPAAAGETEAGNRGPLSGNNLAQLEQATRKP